MSTIRKTYFAKVYDKAGNFITTLNKITEPSFRKQINGGLGQLQFSIPRKFDDFDENYVVAHRNIVEIWCVDNDTGSDGRKIYSGYIPDYNPKISGTKESVTILLYGFKTELNQTILSFSDTNFVFKTDTTDTLKVKDENAQAVKVSDVIKKGIDMYRSLRDAPNINYTSTSIEDSGAYLMTYVFAAPTAAEFLDKCMEFLPEDWFYYVDENKILNVKKKPATATHTFVFGRDFSEIDVDKSIQKLANRVLFTNGDTQPPIVKVYEDSLSIAEYGEYYQKLTDDRVSIEATADNIADNYLTKNAWPEIRVKFDVVDSNNRTLKGYDVESIDPGHTCKIRGYNDITGKTFNDNMMIAGVTYDGGVAVLELEVLQPDIARDVVDLVDSRKEVTLKGKGVVTISDDESARGVYIDGGIYGATIDADDNDIVNLPGGKLKDDDSYLSPAWDKHSRYFDIGDVRILIGFQYIGGWSNNSPRTIHFHSVTGVPNPAFGDNDVMVIVSPSRDSGNRYILQGNALVDYASATGFVLRKFNLDYGGSDDGVGVHYIAIGKKP